MKLLVVLIDLSSKQMILSHKSWSHHSQSTTRGCGIESLQLIVHHHLGQRTHRLAFDFRTSSQCALAAFFGWLLAHTGSCLGILVSLKTTQKILLDCVHYDIRDGVLLADLGLFLVFHWISILTDRINDSFKLSAGCETHLRLDFLGHISFSKFMDHLLVRHGFCV